VPLIDLVDASKHLEFRAVVRESYHRQLSDPAAQLYTDSLAESTLRRYPSTIMVATQKKWFVPNMYNIHGEFDSGTKTFSPYIRVRRTRRSLISSTRKMARPICWGCP